MFNIQSPRNLNKLNNFTQTFSYKCTQVIVCLEIQEERMLPMQLNFLIVSWATENAGSVRPTLTPCYPFWQYG